MRAAAVQLRAIQSYALTVSLYLCSLGFVTYLLLPAPTAVHAAAPLKLTVAMPAKQEAVQTPTLTSGKPVRIVIDDYGIDLAVDEGLYLPDTSEWTLSDDRAQFAMMTVLANNISGNTLIYGHGTDQVFGRLSATPPTPATTVTIYTDNDHIFSYTFEGVKDYAPTDTSTLSYSGPPVLTIQTCTGPLSEWRTLFQFKFDRIVR